MRAMTFHEAEEDILYQREYNQEEGEDLYQGLPTDQSMYSPPSSVEEMEYEEVIKLLKYLNIKSTESGERDRWLLENYLYAERRIGSYEDKIQDTVNKTMNKFVAEKDRLLESYIEIKQIARTDAFKENVFPSLKERFPEFMEQLHERITKLLTDDIEICIFGWTCAGKSTFFNILLGEEIMPTHVLPDTRCLVRLHNSQTRREIQYEAAGEKKTLHLTEDPQNTKRQLKTILDQKQSSGETLDVLDLYWPIPMFHENIVFVDTPGIGEKHSLTELVMKHVPNAAGYICIINSNEAGGVTEGGIVQLLKAIAERKGQTEKKLGNVLFVCNKWDLIEKQNRQVVSENTRKELGQFFGIVEDWQIIHFSARVELQFMQLRANPTDDFLKVLVGLEQLVSETEKSLVFDFSGWLKNVIEKSVGITDTTLSFLSLSSYKLIELTTKTATSLEETKIKLESKSNNLETMVDMKKCEIIKDLQVYLKSSQVQKRAGDWKQTNLKRKPSEIVIERIHMLLSEWAENKDGLLKKGKADVLKEFINFAMDIEKCLISIHNMEMDFCPERTDEGNSTMSTSIVLGILTGSTALTGITVLAVASEITVVVAGIAFAPLALALTFAIAGLVSIFHDKTSQLTKLTLESLKQVSKDECTGKLINTLFELPMKNLIKQYRSTVQRDIASRHKLVQELSADVERATDLQSKLVSLFHELNKCLKDLEKIGLEYHSDDSVSYECLSIDRTTFSATEMFHLHDVAYLIEGKSFSLQVIHPIYSVFQLQAISKLKKMKHTNFMRPEGVVYSTSILDSKACGCSIYSLRLLIQKSIGDLEQYVFTNQCVQGGYSGELAADFFQKMTLGIANGLSYVHEMRFVHGHLQLSSILLAEDMTPKLCHINVLPSLQERNHNICIFHTAPEVINGKKYGPKADIYSLGILLWELWYGRHTPPGMNQTEKSVTHGVRPKFKEKYPKNGWIDVIRLCWNDSPDRRPSAAAFVRTSSNVV